MASNTGLSSGPQDAIAASHFSIVVDGTEIAQFNELQGIATEIDVIEYQGGAASMMGIITKVPGRQKAPNIVLKRGKSTSMEIYGWYEAALLGKHKSAKRNGSLILYDFDGQPASKYHFFNAWISKITLSGMKAGASEILMEEVTIVCERLDRIE
jgi:phage tail-like protein